jgi:hypothetical protein
VNGLLLQDSGRSGKSRWTTDTIARGEACGIILSPFTTPKEDRPREKSASQIIELVTSAGGTVVFDPTTHAALLPTTDAWTRYDTWDLWGSPRRDVSDKTRRQEHVRRALDAQTSLGLKPLAPTLDLDSSIGQNADVSLELATFARSHAGTVAMAIVGSGAFWAQGRLLDDYVGQIAQLRPAGVFLSVRRHEISYPPDALRAEIAGLCRSVYSLSRRCEVVVQFSDYFGLPAIAAGASAIGTGWDLRQRVLAPPAFRVDTTTRRTSSRITHSGLYGVLKRPEAELLRRANRAASLRLVPGVLPADGNALWEHHLHVLASTTALLLCQTNERTRSMWLRDQYRTALAEFAQVDRLVVRLHADSTKWLDAVSNGLGDFMIGEGW